MQGAVKDRYPAPGDRPETPARSDAAGEVLQSDPGQHEQEQHDPRATGRWCTFFTFTANAALALGGAFAGLALGRWFNPSVSFFGEFGTLQRFVYAAAVMAAVYTIARYYESTLRRMTQDADEAAIRAAAIRRDLRFIDAAKEAGLARIERNRAERPSASG